MNRKNNFEKNKEITKKVQKLMLEEKFTQAHEILIQELKKEDNPKFRSMLVKLYIHEGNNQKALKLVDKCMQEYPYDGVFIAQKAEAYVMRGDIQSAKEMLEWAVRNGIEDKRILLQLKSIALGENDFEKEKQIDQKIIKDEKNRNFTGKGKLRNKIYNKEKEMEQKLTEINLKTLLEENNEEQQKKLQELQDYYFGIARYGVVGGKVKLENINTLVKAYKRMNEKEMAKQIIKRWEMVSNHVIEENGETLEKINKEMKKENFDDYVYQIKDKMKNEKIKAREIFDMINKMTNLPGNQLEKMIVSLNMFEKKGYQEYKKNIMARVQKKIKTDKEREFFERALDKIETKEINNDNKTQEGDGR